MNIFRHISCRLGLLFLFLITTLSVCMAQREPAAPKYEPPAWSSYMASYAIVVLCIGLALLIVCHPIRRRDKPLKQQQAEQ